MFCLPLVNSQQVDNVQLDSKDQADNKQAVGDDGGGRGRFDSKGVQDGFPDVVWQLLAFLDDVPGTVQEDVSHPCMVGMENEKFCQYVGSKSPKTRSMIPRVDSRPESFVVLRAHDRVSAGDGLEHRLVGLVSDAFTWMTRWRRALSLRYLVPEFGDDHGTTAGPDRSIRARCRRAVRVESSGCRRAKRRRE
jgi:hypothetical protein